MTAPLEQYSFGRFLKHWRHERGMSQLELACESEISQRHISFLESGRSQPSHDMVLRLARVLDIPLRQQNLMLTAAGFPPVYSDYDLSAPELGTIRQALDYLLHQQDPYPALVMDRYWTVLQANQGTYRLLRGLMGSDLDQFAFPLNVMELMVHPQGLRPYVEDWHSIRVWLLEKLQDYPGTEVDKARFTALRQDLDLEQNQGSENAIAPILGGQLPVLPITFVKADRRLSFFSIISTLGTPQDITLQELRVESLFPMDEATAEMMRDWKRDPPSLLA
jgi:transcriptional regulator with XRE-family HTH domain